MTVLLTLGVIFVNGWTDAPNAIATCVTTRCLPPKTAIIMSAIFNFLGVFIMTHINASVASTISNMVDFGANTDIALIALCAALFSIVVYSVGASIFGIPTSESHSLIAGLTGAAIALGGADGVNMDEWVKVLYGLVLSLALGFGMGWIICKGVTLLFAGTDRRRSNTFFKWAQIAGAAGMSFMHGAQDGQKFIGVLFLGVAFCNGQPSVENMLIPVWLMLLCSVVMGVGTSVGGEKIIKSVGMDMVKLEKYQGFSALQLPVHPARHPHRHPGFHHACQDERHHGRGRGQAPLGHQLRRCQEHDAHLGIHVPGLRPHQFRDGKAVPAVPVNAWAPPWRKESERTDHGKEKRLVLLG